MPSAPSSALLSATAARLRAAGCVFAEDEARLILRAAAEAGLPVIDLRLVCAAAADYSAISPIEPSVQGGAKIAAAQVMIFSV